MTFTTGPSTGSATIDTAAESRLDRLFLPAPPADRPTVTSPEAAAEILAPMFFGLDREACFVLHLDTKHRLLGTEMLSLGSVDHTFMAPRDLFRGALLANASAVVIAHNHPSGDREPSRDDELVTRRLVNAGEMVGVNLLDHLVFGGQGWTSLARRGLI